jgi:Lamin-B receptor of TUDOR domain
LYPIGTTVAKQFDAIWFEGVVQRYDDEDGLYWVLYSDGDSEDLDETEIRDAVHNYRVHVQQQEEAVAEVDTTAVGGDSLSASADINDATVSLTANEAVPAADVPAADTNSLQSSSILDASDVAVAMRAMTAAAEQLTSAAARIEVAVQQQRQSQQQQQQQQLSPWHLHRSWHHVMLQHQQQAYYQQQQQHIWNWQQWQQWQQWQR